MVHVLFSAGEEIVQAQNVVALYNQAITEMRAEKSGATGNQNSTSIRFLNF